MVRNVTSEEEKRLFLQMTSDWWDTNDKKQWIYSKQLEWVQKKLPVKYGTALDIGTGKGRYARLLGASGSVIGIDINDSMLQLTNDYTGCEVSKMDAENLGFRENSFDVITAMELTPHIPGIHRMLSEVYGVLRRGGYFYVSITNSHSLYTLWTMKVNPTFRKIKHLRVQYSPSEFEELLRSHDFTIIDKSGVGTIPPLSLYPGWRYTLVPSHISEWCSDRLDRRLGSRFGTTITYMAQKSL